jgi:hypothetical protein
MHWPDPAQRPRIAEIPGNLIARIAEAEREGWLGEVEGLQISLGGANDKLAQIDHRSTTPTIDLGIPSPRAQPLKSRSLVQRMRKRVIHHPP